MPVAVFMGQDGRELDRVEQFHGAGADDDATAVARQEVGEGLGVIKDVDLVTWRR